MRSTGPCSRCLIWRNWAAAACCTATLPVSRSCVRKTRPARKRYRVGFERSALPSTPHEFEQSDPFLTVQFSILVFVEQVEDRDDALSLLWCHLGRQIFQCYFSTKDCLQILHRKLLLKALH